MNIENAALDDAGVAANAIVIPPGAGGLDRLAIQAPPKVVIPGVYTVDEIMATSQDVQWRVNGLLPDGGILIVSGSPGSGKSMFILDLALAVADSSRGKWIGKFTTAPGTALLIDMENPLPLMNKRLRLLSASRDANLLVMNDPPVNLRDDRDVAELRRKIAAIGPDLIVFDSLRRLHAGSENDSSEMAALMATIASLSPAAKIIIHHTRKNGACAADRLRGSSDLSAAVDSHLAIVGTENGVSQFVHAKSRWDNQIEDFKVEWSGDGTTLVFRECQPEETQKAGKDQQIVVEIMRAGGAMNRKQIMAKLAIAESSVNRLLDKLITDNRLTKRKQGRETIYSVAAPVPPADTQAANSEDAA